MWPRRSHTVAMRSPGRTRSPTARTGRSSPPTGDRQLHVAHDPGARTRGRRRVRHYVGDTAAGSARLPHTVSGSPAGLISQATDLRLHGGHAVPYRGRDEQPRMPVAHPQELQAQLACRREAPTRDRRRRRPGARRRAPRRRGRSSCGATGRSPLATRSRATGGTPAAARGSRQGSPGNVRFRSRSSSGLRRRAARNAGRISHWDQHDRAPQGPGVKALRHFLEGDDPLHLVAVNPGDGEDPRAVTPCPRQQRSPATSPWSRQPA